MPALTGGKEKAKRAGCTSNVRQFLLAAHMYANDNDQRLPSGASESRTPNGVVDDSVPVFSGTIRTQMIHYAGTYKMLGCPSLGRRLIRRCYFEAGYGCLVTIIRGSHTNTP